MARKTIYRYRCRMFQHGNEQTGDFEHYRLSPDPHVGINGKRDDHWAITWLAERWTIEFPDGLRRARFCPADETRYHIGNKDFSCELSGVIYLASVNEEGSRIVKHEIFPEPIELTALEMASGNLDERVR